MKRCDVRINLWFLDGPAVSDCSWGAQLVVSVNIRKSSNSLMLGSQPKNQALLNYELLQCSEQSICRTDEDGLVDCKHAYASFKFNDHFSAGISRPSELTTMKSYYCAEDVCVG